MTEDPTALDFYSYGRARERTPLPPTAEQGPTFLCVGCGASVVARDADLVRHLGWRILPPKGSDAGPEHPVLCPRCARRPLATLPR